MGLSCSKEGREQALDGGLEGGGIPDPDMYDFWKRSVQLASGGTTKANNIGSKFGGNHSKDGSGTSGGGGQLHLLYKFQQHSSTTINLLNGAATTAAATINSSTGGSTAQQEEKQYNHQAAHQYYPTRLLIRRHSVRSTEEGVSGTHIYACRWNEVEAGDDSDDDNADPEQCPATVPQPESAPAAVNVARPAPAMNNNNTTATTTPTTNSATINSKPKSTKTTASAGASSGTKKASNTNQKTSAPSTTAGNVTTPTTTATTSTTLRVDNLFSPATMAPPPKRKVVDWVTVSEDHRIYVADTGLTVAETDRMIAVTEHACKGQYAAYTYAKQTLGCREYPALAVAVQSAVHTVVSAILENDKQNNSSNKSRKQNLALDDREPHMVKYDVTRKERQKLDMHTDKSEWTFLVALSNGCGLDYYGGGTYFECLDATVHVQRGHCLVFPGKLRHCGQRITSGLRFLLVGFLVDKSSTATGSNTTKVATTGENVDGAQQPSSAYISNIP